MSENVLGDDDIIEVPSPNHNKRVAKITAIILHDTGGHTAKGTLSWFANPTSKVSAHYLIGKDGSIYRCVDDEDRAWHAGVSSLHGVENVNDFSLGIELVDDNDADPYPQEQLDALVALCSFLVLRYDIPLNRIVGHNQVCIPPGRKIDPGRDFPWFEFLNTVGSQVMEEMIKNG